MPSSSKIKSAIRARGTAERELTRDYSDVTSSLLESELSSKEFELDKAESTEAFETLYSGLELADTLSVGFEEKRKLKGDIAAFEGSLPKGASPLRIEKKPTMMDFFSRKAKLSDVVYGQDEYFLGERSYGSKYDVAARGKKIKALDSVEDLLGSMGGEPFSSDIPRTLGDFNPELKFDFSKLQNKQKTDFTSHIKDKWKMPGSTESEWIIPDFPNPFMLGQGEERNEDLRGQEEAFGFGV